MEINQSTIQSEQNIKSLSAIAALAYAEKIFQPLIDAETAYYAKKDREAIEKKILGAKDE